VGIIYGISQPFFQSPGFDGLLQFSQKGQDQEEPKGPKAAQLMDWILEQGIHCCWLAQVADLRDNFCPGFTMDVSSQNQIARARSDAP